MWCLILLTRFNIFNSHQLKKVSISKYNCIIMYAKAIWAGSVCSTHQHYRGQVITSGHIPRDEPEQGTEGKELRK